MIAVYYNNRGARKLMGHTPLEPLAVRLETERIGGLFFGSQKKSGIPIWVIYRFLSNCFKMSYIVNTHLPSDFPGEFLHVVSSWRVAERHALQLRWNATIGAIEVFIGMSIIPEEVARHEYQTAIDRQGRSWPIELHVCYIGPSDGDNAHCSRIPWVDHYYHQSRSLPNWYRIYDPHYNYHYFWVEDFCLSDIPAEELLVYVNHPVLSYLATAALVTGDRYWEKYERKFKCPLMSTPSRSIKRTSSLQSS